MKNVLIIARALSYGGAEKTAVNLANQLSSLNRYRVYLCVLDGTEKTYPVSTKVNLVCLGLDIFKKGNKIGFYQKLFSGISKLKKEKEIDVSISFLSEPDLANIVTKKAGEKTIISVRNKQSKISTSAIKIYRDKFLFNKADTIVSLSKMVKKDLIDKFLVNPSKIEVIYNFGNEEHIKSESNKEIEETDKEIFSVSKNVVINVGRLVEQKGQWHLIKAFKKVVTAIPNAKLIILGQGEMKNQLTQLIEDLKLSNSVFLLGFKKNPYPYIKNSKMFVFSSLFEGLGNVLIETASCGTPIISTDCDAGPREILAPETDPFMTGTAKKTILGSYGILVPNLSTSKNSLNIRLDDEEEILADTIIEFLSNEKLNEDYTKKIITRSYDFSDKKILQEWIDLIEAEIEKSN